MFGKGSSKIVGDIVGIADKLVTDKDKKQEIASEVVQNEIVSGSSFVRNARPMIIYTGLCLIILEFFGLRLLLLSLMGGNKLMIESSTQIFQFFLMTWSGVTSIYVGGRTYEKAKSRIFKRSK
tara:strand:- start:3400 stop:3768 length:369 start_codon:yes stop_codon:yes gene_type:complete